MRLLALGWWFSWFSWFFDSPIFVDCESVRAFVLDCVSNGSLGSWIFSVCLGDGSRGSLGSSIFLDVLNDGARGSSIL